MIKTIDRYIVVNKKTAEFLVIYYEDGCINYCGFCKNVIEAYVHYSIEEAQKVVQELICDGSFEGSTLEDYDYMPIKISYEYEAPIIPIDPLLKKNIESVSAYEAKTCEQIEWKERWLKEHEV